MFVTNGPWLQFYTPKKKTFNGLGHFRKSSEPQTETLAFALLDVHGLNGVNLPVVGPVRAIGPPSGPGAIARGHVLDIDDKDVTWQQT